MVVIWTFVIYRVRVANELGAGNGKAARFSTVVSVIQSSVIGIFFCVLIMILRDKYAYLFTSTTEVLEEVDKLTVLLAATILLNSVQPILSGNFLRRVNKAKLLPWTPYLTWHIFDMDMNVSNAHLKKLYFNSVFLFWCWMLFIWTLFMGV